MLAGCSGEVAARRNQARPVAAPGTTVNDPVRARYRTRRINHRVAGRVSPVPVGTIPERFVHVEKAPRVVHIARRLGLLEVISCRCPAVPIVIRIRGGDRRPQNTLSSFPPGRRIPLRLVGKGSPTIGQPSGCSTALSRARKRAVRNLFTGRFGSLNISWGRTQAVHIARHHRCVLSLSCLVLAQVKAFGQGGVVLGLVGLPTSLRNRLPW